MVNLLNYVDDFGETVSAVEAFLFGGGEFNLAVSDGVDSIIRTHPDTFAGKEFRASLADDNIASFGNLTVV